MTVWGGHGDVGSAKLGTTSDGATTVTYAGAKAVHVGDYVKVFADDEIPGDQGGVTRVGQAMQVTAVNGTTLTLAGELHYAELYKTNVRASAYESGTAVVTDGTIRGDQSHPTWATNLLDVRGTIGTSLDHIVVRDGNSMGINFSDSVNGLVTQSAAINLTDDTAHGHYGYGVHSGMSLNTTVDGFYAEKVRHATDDNAVGSDRNYVNASKYGADINMTVSNVVAVGTTAYAFSWHSEGRFSSVTDSIVVDSYGVLGARGLDNTFANVSAADVGRGIMFFEYGDGDGRRINASDVNIKEDSGFAYYNQNSPYDNTLSNSVFEIQNDKVELAANDPSLTVTGTTIKVGAFAVNEDIDGSSYEDRLLGGEGDDIINGYGDKDYILGGHGADDLTGGAGSDRFAYLNVDEAGDTIEDFTTGTDGDVIDVSGLWYHYGWTTLDGHVRFVQSGSDTLFQVDADGGANSWTTMATLVGIKASAIGDDNVSADVIVTSDGTAHLSTVTSTAIDDSSLPAAFADLSDYRLQKGHDTDDNLIGTTASDLLIGYDGSDTLTGDAGDDVLAGGAGADILSGGSGTDIASYADAANGLTASLNTPSSNTGDAAGDTYKQIEGLTGSAFNDKLTGNDSMNTLSGGGGNDTLYGLGGGDTLYGNDGNDTLYGGDNNDILFGGSGDDILQGGTGFDKYTGGSGADRFYLDGPNTGAYKMVSDFEHGIDDLVLSKSAYGVSSTSQISFVSGSSPKVATDHATLLYNTASGAVYWDADGTGSQAAVHIADLQNVPSGFNLGDIVLI